MSRTTRSRGFYGWLHDGEEIHYLNREWRMQLFYRSCNFANPRWYEKYVKTDEEFLKDTQEQYARWQRDGRDGLTLSKSNTGYKHDSKKKIRRLNKEFCRLEVAGQDTDDIPEAIRKDGKTYKWDWW